MIVFQIDESTGDFAFTNGTIPLISGDAAIRQVLASRLRLVMGEWFLNRSAGTDWFGRILGRKDENFVSANAEFIRVILGTPRIASLSNPIEYDFTARILKGNFTVLTDEGNEISLVGAGI